MSETRTLAPGEQSTRGVIFYLYWLMHVLGIGLLFFVEFSWQVVVLFVVNYFVGMFFVTAGYHRYFSHRSYQLKRIPQFILAWCAQISAQKGVLWWAANHRDHHLHSDTEEDLHSPVQFGFWYSHMGWIFDDRSKGYNAKKIQDFSKFPELRWLNKYHWVPTLTTAILMPAFFAVVKVPGINPWNAFAWGYLLAIICMYQASYSVNSLLHVYGTRRFETDDASRNNWFIAIFTMGEGWHNNHHYCKSSCRQGYKWWEYDLTYYGIKMLSWVGIVKNIKPFRADNTKGVIVEAPAAKKDDMTEAAA